MATTTQPPTKPKNIIFLHPDLGIGGAERLILDAALGLQSLGHKVTIYTSHRDPAHCFEEARDGSLDVRVRGNTIFPAHVLQRLHILMASLRQVHLVLGILWGGEVKALTTSTSTSMTTEKETGTVGSEQQQTTTTTTTTRLETVFVVDQLSAGVPLLRWFARGETRVLFYCHFPDLLLARRDEGGFLLGLVKSVYRLPFDWFEGWSLQGADRVVVNSRFTRRTVSRVFRGFLKEEDLRVVHPCVDTGEEARNKKVEAGVRDMVQEEVDETGHLWGGKKILLSINRFERKKDIGLAIRAYHGLKPEERKNTRLVVAGGYDNRVLENVQYHKELDTLASDLGLQTATAKTVISALDIPSKIDVLFLLSIPNAFKSTLLNSSKLLLYTPTNEHFGIVPVEAMYAGLPVLAANTGGPLETIVDGETGWLRDVKDVNAWTDVMRIVLFKKKESELAQMGQKGKQRVEKEFSRDVMATRLDDEISQMLKAPRTDFVEWESLFISVVFVGFFAAVAFAVVWEVLYRERGHVVLADMFRKS